MRYVYYYSNKETISLIMSVKNRNIIILFICLAAVLFLAQFPANNHTDQSVQFRTNGTRFEIYKNGGWQDFTVKGVNIGASKPGYFPGEMGIDKTDYLRWFGMISEMNANAIRVYTILGPGFYEALYEHNKSSPSPLYLFHGVWNNEENVNLWQNAYHPEITDEFKSEIADLIDLLHGNKTIQPRFGHASGTYARDVSPFVAGYILGIEHDGEFVCSTNDENSDIVMFEGDYLYTRDASPYECWLAQIGDYAIGYETEKYQTQKPVSWTNWITTDPLWHYSDPDRYREDAVSVDTEHILCRESFEPGLFASYHVYPYYPEFMMYDPVYTVYTDKKGKINPYEAYLRDLQSWHSVPLLVAEFGLPTSRGQTHENILTGYNQGFVSEEKAGEYVADMFDSIIASGCCGGMVFSWQDEWSKRSWNTMDYDLPDRRAYWSNPQVSEQCYGILTFDPGEVNVCCVDGDISEWKNTRPITQNNGLELSVMNDQKYVYLLVRDSNMTDKSRYAIAVGSSGQGNFSYPEEGLEFDFPASQCIIIDGENNSAIYVDAYCDVFYRQYSLLDFLNITEKNEAFETKNSGIFNPIRLVLRRSLDFPLTGLHLPPSVYETGKLLHGSTNPDSADYNSLADFFINLENHSIEIRIPWQLLNVADPSTKTVFGDLYAGNKFDINPVQTEGFAFELFSMTDKGPTEGGGGFYSWKPWEAVNYHERLKKSYGTIQKKFGEY